MFLAQPTRDIVRQQRGDRAGDDGQAPEEGDEGRDGALFALAAGEREVGDETEGGEEEAEREDDERDRHARLRARRCGLVGAGLGDKR